ncbi:uncharacterized protein B0I36DRAFT_407663, partial [Microdochium trichocladiopsis]
VRLWCPTGKHRVLAASEDTEWIVQLHCPPAGTPHNVVLELVRQLAEDVSYYYPKTDGEIYCSLRHYHSPHIIQEWMGKLSPCKRDTLKLLQSNSQLSEAFGGLLKFPGLWEGFQLGNIHKHMALHCDKELITYLTFIQQSWEHIVDHNVDLMQLVDFSTVRHLQLLAPTLSCADHEELRAKFRSGTIFSNVEGRALLARLEKNVLHFHAMIPSIRSFHENMKLFSVTVKIIRRLLLPGSYRKSFSESLRSIWTSPDPPVIEVDEGIFQVAKSALSFEVAYWQLVLAALRNFARLGNEGPRVDRDDRIDGHIEPTALAYFQRRALLLGFQSDVIRHGARSDTGIKGLRRNDGPADEQIAQLSRRWGRPHSRVYRQIQRVAFLQQLSDRTRMEHLSVPSLLSIATLFKSTIDKSTETSLRVDSIPNLQDRAVE